jgi:hypothetical protein
MQIMRLQGSDLGCSDFLSVHPHGASRWSSSNSLRTLLT